MLAFPVLLVPTTVEPLHWDTSIQGTPPFKGHKNLVPEKCSHNLCICYLYLGERDTFVGPKAQVLLPFSRVPINAHVCVFCNQKSKRTHASLSARVSDTHKDIFATILEIPTCFINQPFCLIGDYVHPTQSSSTGQRKKMMQILSSFPDPTRSVVKSKWLEEFSQLMYISTDHMKCKTGVDANGCFGKPSQSSAHGATNFQRSALDRHQLGN